MKLYFSDYWSLIKKSRITLILTDEDIEAYKKADQTTIQQLLDAIIEGVDNGKIESEKI